MAGSRSNSDDHPTGIRLAPAPQHGAVRNRYLSLPRAEGSKQNSGDPKAAAELVFYGEVFTFRAGLGKRDLGGWLTTG